MEISAALYPDFSSSVGAETIFVLPFPLHLQPPTACMATRQLLRYIQNQQLSFRLNTFTCVLKHLVAQCKIFMEKSVNLSYQQESQTVAHRN